jgi:hypothetical protein
MTSLTSIPFITRFFQPLIIDVNNLRDSEHPDQNDDNSKTKLSTAKYTAKLSSRSPILKSENLKLRFSDKR